MVCTLRLAGLMGVVGFQLPDGGILWRGNNECRWKSVWAAGFEDTACILHLGCAGCGGKQVRQSSAAGTAWHWADLFFLRLCAFSLPFFLFLSFFLPFFLYVCAYLFVCLFAYSFLYWTLRFKMIYISVDVSMKYIVHMQLYYYT